jgi:hypothetical protein
MNVKRMSDAELLRKIAKAWAAYEGDVTLLESAIGALVLGREVGWHGIRVMHSRGTFNKYERILKLRFREVLAARGPDSRRLHGIWLIEKLGKFWQALSGGLISAKEAALTVDKNGVVAGGVSFE